MTNPNVDSTSEQTAKSPAPPTAPPAGGDLEAQGGGASSIMERWKRQDLLRRCSIASRLFSFIFSLLAFVIMASNKHGYWRNFDQYDEYRYVLAISILSTLYTGVQCFRHFHELSTGRELFSFRINLPRVDFIGDQILAYLLISAASSAVPLTNSMREGADNSFTDASATAISMEFFAFFSLALSALISGYKLSNQTYI